MDFVGELHAGGRRADDQHAAVGQLIRIAVVERREATGSTAARACASAGTLRQVAGAAGQHQRAAAEFAVVRDDLVAVVGLP